MPKRVFPAHQHLPVPVQLIERRIYIIRGHRVMLDADLAELYDVETFNLNKAVKRNRDRFPSDFMFQLNAEEAQSLRFQIGMSKPSGRGGRRYLPFVFTEQGVAMLSSVLSSKRAIGVNIAIMRAFVKIRELLATHKDVAHKLGQLERQQHEHGVNISAIWKAIQKLITAPAKPSKRIGFRT